MPATDNLPRIGLTMGDLAGVGPEVIARAWSDPNLHKVCRPLVIGDPEVLSKAIWLVRGQAGVVSIDRPELAEPSTGDVPCLAPTSIRQLGPLIEVPSGQVDRRAGRAAYDCLISAIDLALEGRIA
jgi:4-phospho-D-threonate 3-dehydrogenase / 4-phospho-D-erythronate 3-dehydrogenase